MGDFLFVDLWSDVVCPFCYLGTRQLFLAINQFEHRGHVVVRHRAFELDPGSRTDINLPLDELLARKYSMPIERARALNQRVEDEAATLGMTWSLATARPTNTFDAHRLIAFGELVSDHETLSRLATEVEVEGADELWSGDTLADAVRQDESAAQELGITGVPAFLVDNKFMVVGAQGADKILEVLRRAWARRSNHSSGSAGTNAAVATE